MKYFAFLTFLIFTCYLLGFVKKPEKYQWMDRNYTTAIKGFSILTVVWAHSGAMLSVEGIQFIAGIGVALFLMCSGYGLEISHEKKGLVGFWKKRLLGVCLPFWAMMDSDQVGTVEQSHFVRNYRTAMQRIKEDRRMPEKVRTAIAEVKKQQMQIEDRQEKPKLPVQEEKEDETQGEMSEETRRKLEELRGKIGSRRR